MHIEELKVGELLEGKVESEREEARSVASGDIVIFDAKRVLVGAGARALFYPTLLYNVVRNKVQAEFRWWDWIDESVLLGAVPFPSDVKRLKELGVCGVVTMNEPYETLVPTSLYQDYGINQLVLPTRDYLFAPSLNDICQAVDFIHGNASCGQRTYVHCKAGRGRSTTIVICYLVQHKHMLPEAAYDYVKSIRPRVLLAPSQWQAVREYYHWKVNKHNPGQTTILVFKTPRFFTAANLLAFDDGSVVVVTKADLDGYDPSNDSVVLGGEILANLSLVCRVRVAGQAALARLSCFWFQCNSHQKIAADKPQRESSCSIMSDHLGNLSVDIHVY